MWKFSMNLKIPLKRASRKGQKTWNFLLINFSGICVADIFGHIFLLRSAKILKNHEIPHKVTIHVFSTKILVKILELARNRGYVTADVNINWKIPPEKQLLAIHMFRNALITLAVTYSVVHIVWPFFDVVSMNHITKKPEKNESLHEFEILQFWAMFQTAVESYWRFIWITNSSDHGRVLTTNLLHMMLLIPIGHKV